MLRLVDRFLAHRWVTRLQSAQAVIGWALFFGALIPSIMSQVSDLPTVGLVIMGLGVFLVVTAALPPLIARARGRGISRASAESLALESTELARRVAALLAEHKRDEPMHWDPHEDPSEDPHAAWARSANRHRASENRTLAKYTEQAEGEVFTVANELLARRALTNDETQQIVFAGRTTHWLEDVPGLLLLGARRLRNGDLVPNTPPQPHQLPPS